MVEGGGGLQDNGSEQAQSNLTGSGKWRVLFFRPLNPEDDK